MYVPLHVHSRFSLLDSLIDVSALACRAKEIGAPAVAVTDHGALYGLIYFYKACKKAGIKPILGCELHVKEDLLSEGDIHHLVVLARNEAGYKNLLRLATEAALGATQKAIVDHKMLQKYGRGLIATSACLQGEVPKALLAGDTKKAEELALWHSRVFDGFYLELQANTIPEQAEVNRALVELSRSTGTPLSAASDAHYLLPEDADSHDVLLAVQTRKLVTDENRLRFSTQDFWVMTEEEMRSKLASAGVDSGSIDAALANTLVIADQCSVAIDLSSPAMPVYQPTLEEERRYGSGLSSEELLRAMAYDGLRRLGLQDNEEYVSRLNEELSVICDAGFASYFLVVQDIVGWAKRNGIMVGPGRGSVGGCLTAYVLGITEVDSIKHGLIFERFLNRERAMNDYDWTWPEYPPQEGDAVSKGMKLLRELSKEELKEASWELAQMRRQGLGGYYARLQRWGPKLPNLPQSWLAYGMGLTDERPASLARTRLRVLRQGSAPDIDVDIADDERHRVFEYVLDRYGHDRVAQIGNITTMGARETIRRVAKVFGLSPKEADGLSARVPKTPGITLEEALAQSPELQEAEKAFPDIFKHARKIEGCASTTSIHAAGLAIAPCEITELAPLHKGRGGEVVTQYDMNAIGDLCLKIDLLGLKTLSVIRHALKLIGESPGFLKEFPLDDPNVYRMLSEGDSDGVFQVSSPLFKGLLREVRPACFEDLVALLSLGRPGPGSMADIYIRRRKGEEPVEYLHLMLEKILKRTYGVPLFQEQVMQIARDLAGYTLGQADILRKAMGKKIPEVMEKERAHFVAGCKANGIDERTADEIFNQIAEFAGYGFNLAHSLEYAIITYWTALLKYYYPAEYLTACLTDEANSGSPERRAVISLLVNKARGLGVRVLPPDINKSSREFAIEELGDEKAIRIGLCAIDQVGGSAIDEILAKRPFTGLEDFIARVNKTVINKSRAEALIYSGCFDFEDEDRHAVYRRYLQLYAEIVNARGKKAAEIEERLAAVPAEWTRKDRIRWERKLLGFPVSDLMTFAAARVGQYLRLAGTVGEVLVKQDRYGRDMCFLTLLTDEGESVRVTVFARTYRKATKLLKNGYHLTVWGYREDHGLTADEIERHRPRHRPHG